MWEPVGAKERTEAEWQTALGETVATPDALACARFIFQIASQANEFYIGGNVSPFLIQVLSAPSEDGDVDLIATLLSPLEAGVHICCTVRGEEALKACGAFMDAFPEAPVLLQKSDGAFDYVLCALTDEAAWKRRPVTLRALTQALKASTEADSLAFYLPAEAAQPADAGRPAISLERFEARPDVILD